MALLSTEQFDRAAKVLKATLKRVRHSLPARVLSRIHHDAYQRVQADQARLENARESRPNAPYAPARSRPFPRNKEGDRVQRPPSSR
ncbi:MAG: hypothetical protein AAFX40_12600 [Cyanobacteria bacterium J06639_1]